MAKRYTPKNEYVEPDGKTPVDWSRATRGELLIVEKFELEEAMKQEHPAILTLRRLQAVDRQLHMAEERKRAEEAERKAPWAGPEESRVESKLRTGGVDRRGD